MSIYKVALAVFAAKMVPMLTWTAQPLSSHIDPNLFISDCKHAYDPLFNASIGLVFATETPPRMCRPKKYHGNGPGFA